MARIGKRVLSLPKGVEVKVADGKVEVKGPLGRLVQGYNPVVEVKIEGDKISTLCEDRDTRSRALHGLYNSLIKNMIDGVTRGFEKNLELSGVGYRALMQGKKLQIQIGYSHPVEIDPPEGISFAVDGATRIKVKGIDRQMVGKVAAEIRLVRQVEPYKGKGIKYAGEAVRRKAGKAAKAAAGGTGA
jgi:large subunit ribosomal protein L6